MYHHFKKKGENKLTCSNKDVFSGSKVSLLKNVITLNTGVKIDGVEIIYCFSCSDISYYSDVDEFRKAMIGPVPGMGYKNRFEITDKGTISDETIRQILNLKSNCEEFSDDDFSDDEEQYIPKKASDAIPYLEELGIYESLKNKNLIVEDFDDFLQKSNIELKVGILQHVRELSNKFVKQYPEVEDSFPTISDKYGNANDAAIDYYERLNDYLEEFDLKKLYISLADEKEIFDITPHLSSDGTTLDLSGSQISSLAGIDFSKLNNLIELNLSRTQISSLADVDFSTLKNLRDLYLTGSKIKSIADVDFSGLSRLEYLDISDTPLESLVDVNLSGLSNLETLGLSNTKIESLTGVDFSGLSNLDILDLRDTPIETLVDVDFSGLNLRKLKLSGTQISSLEKQELSRKYTLY